MPPSTISRPTLASWPSLTNTLSYIRAAPGVASAYEDRVVMRPLAFFDAGPFFSFSKFLSKAKICRIVPHVATTSFTYPRCCLDVRWMFRHRFSRWTDQSLIGNTGELHSVEDIPWGECLLTIDPDDVTSTQQTDKLKGDLNELIMVC